MPKISNAIVSANIRKAVFDTLNIANVEGFKKINDRQFGIIITDDNGIKRYARVGVIVAEERDDCTAEELMNSEIAAYLESQAKKAEKAAERAEKATKDKKLREERKKNENENENENK